jgi:hypothetical protein
MPGGKHLQDVEFGKQNYKVYRDARGGYTAFVATDNLTSGDVNLLEILKWTVTQGWLTSDCTVDQICFGVEVVSTEDEEATFRITEFSIEAKMKLEFDLRRLRQSGDFKN